MMTRKDDLLLLYIIEIVLKIDSGFILSADKAGCFLKTIKFEILGRVEPL